uniref:Calponin-homology (CH) domain-containing protein n=1 Tax=Nomascus leucogenys TaxID=61853 RepID=A0A2I3GAR7_NOMLE
EKDEDKFFSQEKYRGRKFHMPSNSSTALRVKMKYGARYLKPKLWKTCRGDETLTDPKLLPKNPDEPDILEDPRAMKCLDSLKGCLKRKDGLVALNGLLFNVQYFKDVNQLLLFPIGIFKAEYHGQLPILIFPTSGIVDAKSSMVIKVDFCADQPRIVDEEAIVILQGQPEMFLSIKAHVVEQIIELLNMSSDRRLECIHFGPVFFGSSKIKHARIYNNSLEPINWVAIIQDDAVGEELGADIRQRTDIALNNLTYIRKIKNIDTTIIISCLPNEGTLQPYQKTVITFCFTPKLMADGKKDAGPSYRQDYALFLRFESIGSKDGFLGDDDYKTIKSERFQKMELALTGTGLPVLLQFDPGPVLNFKPCFMGERSEIQYIIKNQCELLPVTYHFKKIANFEIDPENGKINGGGMVDVMCSFFPHQLGVFKVKQMMEIIGLVAEEDLQSLSVKSFHHVYLAFNSICKASTKKVVMKFDPGMLLLLLAFPNDRAATIRSKDHHKHFRPIFTKVPRFNYVNHDFAYTTFKKQQKKLHENYYAMYLKYLRSVCLQKKQAERECMYSYDDTDIGLEPGSGLKSPSLSEAEIEEELSSAANSIRANRLLTTRSIASQEEESVRRKVLKGLKSEPSTLQEKHDCSLILTPKQIHQVIVGPSVLNFGCICVNSPNTHLLHVINMLPMHVLLHTYISMVFESPTTGKFWKSFTFTVNNVPSGHILVMAVVQLVTLELSSNELVLRPRSFFMKTCFRGTVRLYNLQNCCAQFQWQPVNTGSGIAFSICPAKGTIEAYSSLECEVTWQQGFSSPEKGEFILHVFQGNALKLKCVAHLVRTKVLLLQPRILFRNFPQGLTTWRKAILQNVGQNHAYFKVCSQSLLPIINIIPSQGIVPFGGITVHNISCKPTVAEKFDTRAKVSIRHAIDLRIGGSAKIADVEINPDVFNFRGAYIGGTQIIPFVIKNKGITRARVEFNLKDFPDFSMDLKDKSEEFKDPAFPYIYSLELEENTSLECSKTFSPKEVTVVEFIIQVQINLSSKLYTKYLSSSPLNPKTVPLIRPCYVQATALQSPLNLPSTKFVFEIPLHEMNPNNKVTKTQVGIKKASGILKCIAFTASEIFIVLKCNVFTFRFSLPVTATAENCILTIYPYMAIHLDKQNIILKNDKDEYLKKTRDDVLPPYQDAKSPSPASIKKTYTTSKFNDAEPAKGNLFIGVEVLPENLRLDESETSKEDDRSMEKEKYEQFLSLEEGTKAHYFFEKVVNAAQTWFSLFGWPEGPHSFSIPETIRRDVYKMQFYSSTSPPQKFSRQNDFSKYSKTICDVLLHLSGKMPPGINSSQSLPVDNHEKRVIQLHLQHSSLLDFLNAQGGCVSRVLPEFLLEPEDCKRWIEITSSTNTMPVEKSSIVIEMSKFEAWSKRAWTDVFLQIYKVLVLSRVVPYCSNNMPPICVQNTPKVNPCFASSNIYSDSERISLSWMNINYENTRHVIWKNCHKDVIPSERWIVNFDKGLSDGLVFATQLGAYCPFLIESHFINMYTQPKSPEEYLHNCLIIVNTLYEIDFDMEIQATDICDPNPILMLMLCVYMYERLPTYLPNKVMSFECTLHDMVLNKILLKNSSSRNLAYNARIVGRDAADFSLSQKGNVVTISPRNEIIVTLKFTSRFIRPAEASLLLISKPKNAVRGITMTFARKGKVLDFKAIDIIKCESPCYQFQKITVCPELVGSCVILVESSTFVSSPTKLTESRQYPKHDDDMSSSGSDTDQGCCDSPNVLHTSIKSTFVREIFCSMHTVHLGVKGTSGLELRFLPFNMRVRYCVIILSNKKIGQLIYVVEGKGMTPLPSSFYYSSTREEGPNKKYPVLYLKCKPNQILYVDLKLPMTDEAKEKALAFAAQQQMSSIEYERRLIPGTLESSSIHVAIALLGLTKIETLMLFQISKLRKTKTVSYTTEVSLPEYFYIPEKIYIPRIPEPQVIKLSKTKASDGSVPLPLQFLPLQPGRYPCTILLKSRYDVRAYYVEGIVNEEQPEAEFEFETPAFEALTQNIPINNQTNDKWAFQVSIKGEWFSGPSELHVGPDKIVKYPLTFEPIFECVVKGKLILQNEVDGMEHIFDIKGVGKKPLALEHITVECQVGNVTQKHITLPHFTNTVLTFKVTTDLPIVWGNPQITVYPYKEILYLIHVRPWKRGILKGTITFSTTRRKHDDYEEDTDQDQALSSRDSTAEQSSILDDAATYGNFNNLRFWYNLKIHSTPGPPIEIMEMTCIALDSTCIEIPLSNPKDRDLHLDVQLTSAALNGDNEIILSPLQCTKYTVWYSPAATGYSDERYGLSPEMAEEFWYLLKLTIELPKPTTMPEIQCDLGKHVTQIVPLVNHTHETLKLQATNSNPENFVLDINRKSQLIISPHSTTELPVLFYPSALGRADHQACINFYLGLYPQPLDMERITTRIGLWSTIVIPFKNPTTEDVLIDITLTSVEHPRNLVIDHCQDSFIYESSAFRFSSLSEIQGTGFLPYILSFCLLFIMGINSEEIQAIHWIYPIVGLPQAPPPKSPPVVIQCQSRKRAEEKMEIILNAGFFRHSLTPDLTEVSVIPKRNSHNFCEDPNVFSICRSRLAPFSLLCNLVTVYSAH